MRDRILHLADLHLGDRHRYLGSKSRDRQNEVDTLFTRITDRLLESDSRVGGVLIAGDLFDHYAPAERLVDSLIADLERLRAADIQVLTVPGNHDEYSYPDSVYRKIGSAWPGTLVVSPTPERVTTWEVEDRRIDLYAMAYVAGRTRGRCDQFVVHSNRALKIAVIHGSLDAPWSDRSVPLKSGALESLGLDYIALGHIHAAKTQRLGKGWVVYPGRIEGGGFDDPGGADLVEIEPHQDSLRPVTVPFPSRRIETLRWNVSGLHDASELIDRIAREADRDSDSGSKPGAIGGRILRIVLEGISAFPIDREEIRNQAKTQAKTQTKTKTQSEGRFFYLDLQTDEEVVEPTSIEEIRNEPTVRGEFVRMTQKRIDEAQEDGDRRIAEAALRFGLAAFSGASGSTGEGHPR